MREAGWLTDPRYDAGLDELARLDVAEARLCAARARVLAGLAARTSRDGWRGPAPFDSLLLDVAGTSRLGQVAAGSRLADAEHLVVRLPLTLASLEAGLLRVQQAQVLVEQTRSLTPEVCGQVEGELLDGGAAERTASLCPADLRRRVKRAVLRLDAEAVAAREARARRDRRVWVQPAQDGMALLCALLPAERALRVHAQLTEQASAARDGQGDTDGRTLDQLRAELLVDTLLGAGQPPSPATTGRPARPVRVVVHVPLAVALGLSDAPAELAGAGPVSAAHARRLLPGAQLQRACVDPDTGQVWALDDQLVHLPAPPERDERAPHTDATSTDHTTERTTEHAVADALRAFADRPPPVPLPPERQHDPSAPLARLVRTRDARCDGIGCSVPASRCELDHATPWPHGGTSSANLVARSQRCHHAKHTGWTAVRGPSGTLWTSPGGRRYRVPPRGPWSPARPRSSAAETSDLDLGPPG